MAHRGLLNPVAEWKACHGALRQWHGPVQVGRSGEKSSNARSGSKRCRLAYERRVAGAIVAAAGSNGAAVSPPWVVPDARSAICLSICHSWPSATLPIAPVPDVFCKSWSERSPFEADTNARGSACWYVRSKYSGIMVSAILAEICHYFGLCWCWWQVWQ